MKGNLTRRGRNSWRLKFEAGADPATGARVTKYHTLKGTRREAQEQAAKIIAEHAGGLYVDPSKQTFTDFAAHWEANWAAKNVSAKTLERYSELIRIHIIPSIGSIPIQRLHATNLQTLYAKLPVAPRTKLHIHRLVFLMLRHATQWGVVQRNVASLVDAPAVQDKEIEILSPAEIARVLEVLKDHPWLHAIVMVALGTGMRRGELLALRWKDVDLDGAKLRVAQALEETAKLGLQFKSPKTKYGRRTITLPSSTVAVLREHLKATLERRLMLGQGKVDMGDLLVFATWDNKIQSPNGMSKKWRKVVHTAKLKATFHSLRHTHASGLIAAGVDVLSISRRLGHGSPAITLGVYGHLFKPDDCAATAIDELLGGVNR
jgi:integrase